MFSFQRRHPSLLLMQDTRRQPDEQEDEPPSTSPQPPLKQARIMTGFSLSQERVNKLIFDFVVEDVQCFSVVEQPSFRKLVEGLSGGKKTMCRKTLMQRMEREFAVMKASVTSKLVDVDTLCTTADIWSAQNRSFFGVTCHWIDKDTLERHSAALACTRLKGRHTYDAVATQLNKIHAEYKIQTKVKCTVTDNGSNFVKAFREFGASDEEADDHSDGVTFADVGSLLQEEEDEHFFLPQHQRCAAHTLNLIATNEVHKAGGSGPSRKLYRSAMAKCSSIWNKAHRSSLAAEAIQDIAKMQLIVPSVTRWSSEFRAIAKVVGLSEDQLRDICDKLDTAMFHPQEAAFLKEYSEVLQPLAVAIDILQGENKCYLGFVIPTLLSLKTKLEEKLPHVIYTAHIITTITEAIQQRFGSVLTSHEAQMAATTLPKFRLCWISPEKRDDMRRMLLQEASALEQQQSPVSRDDDDNGSDGSDDFFVFENGKEMASDSTACNEVRKYLEDSDTSLKSLQAFPIIKKLFVKYNTTLPSSAPVERLFSQGGKVLTPSRNRMTDNHMEQVLLLRYNRHHYPDLVHD